MASLTSLTMAHCESCQKNVQAQEGHCVQCGEPMNAGRTQHSTTTPTPTPTPTPFSFDLESDDNSLLGSLLSQALARGSAANMQPASLDDVSFLTAEQQERFQMLLPMFQQFLQGGGGGDFGDTFGGGGGGASGGAPPASKSVVESLARLTLDASNLREVTVRSIVRVLHQPRAKNAAVLNEEMVDDEKKEQQQVEEQQSQQDVVRPTTLELICEPASFGPEVHQHELLAQGGTRLCLAEPLELDVDPNNTSDLKGAVVVCRRGKCSFASKVVRAERAGAAAVIVLNTVALWPFTMGDSASEGVNLQIPSVMCRKDHGEQLLEMLTMTKKDEEEEGDWVVTMATDGSTKSCAVCQSEFALGDQVLRMPCPGFRHSFHEECIMPWLKMRNTCPTCRHELPTDDKKWNERRADERARESVGREYWDNTVS